MEDARTYGYSNSGTVLPGVGAIAAPAFEGSGEIAATVALVAASEVLAGPGLEELAAELQATAARLSRQLGFTGR